MIRFLPSNIFVGDNPLSESHKISNLIFDSNHFRIVRRYRCPPNSKDLSTMLLQIQLTTLQTAFEAAKSSK